MSIELEVWREACRHIEIDDSLARIAAVMSRELPIDVVCLRRLDRERLRLTTAASVSPMSGAAPGESVTELSPQSLGVLDRLFLGEHIVRPPPGGDGLESIAVPAGIADLTSCDRAVGPLVDPDGHEGVLVLISQVGKPFTEAHLSIAQKLLEPFAVALGNDRRVHELARLREAAEADNRALRTRLVGASAMEPIVGIAGGLAEVMQNVAQVAVTDAPVLILGETGSGKELIARAIHQKSLRAEGPVVRVNCGAIPSELVDSELFGHERGGFTGAVATRKGWFERADGGTLFLDEIGELPAAAQVRLLRVLQDGTLERVGGHRTLHVDVRVVAATHRDLQAMANDGRFRSDLWYRISVFPLRLPSLRERLGDLPELVSYFARRAGDRMGNPSLTATDADMEMLRQYPWPGNIRELVSVIERAAILGRGRQLDIAAALGTGARPTSGAVPAVEPSPRPGAPMPVARLDEAMVKHIEQALHATAGRIEGPNGAAALLSINPHTLRARMRKLGIDWARFRGAGREPAGLGPKMDS